MHLVNIERDANCCTCVILTSDLDNRLMASFTADLLVNLILALLCARKSMLQVEPTLVSGSGARAGSQAALNADAATHPVSNTALTATISSNIFGRRHMTMMRPRQDLSPIPPQTRTKTRGRLSAIACWPTAMPPRAALKKARLRAQKRPILEMGAAVAATPRVHLMRPASAAAVAGGMQGGALATRATAAAVIAAMAPVAATPRVHLMRPASAAAVAVGMQGGALATRATAAAVIAAMAAAAGGARNAAASLITGKNIMAAMHTIIALQTCGQRAV